MSVHRTLLPVMLIYGYRFASAAEPLNSSPPNTYEYKNVHDNGFLDRHLQSLDENAWHIGDIVVNSGVDGVPGRFQVVFDHGSGAAGSGVVLELYSSISAITPMDNCYSQGGTLLGAVTSTGTDTPTIGLDTDAYELNVDSANSVYGKSTSFTWEFNIDIDTNPGLYSATTDASGDILADISFCTKLSLIAGGENVNYKEYAMQFAYTLDASHLEFSATVSPDHTVEDYGSADTFTVTAELCTTDPIPSTLNDTAALAPGTPVAVCVKSDAYPQASVVGIDSLSFAANSTAARRNLVGNAISAQHANQNANQNSVSNGHGSPYSRVEHPTKNKYGQYCRVQTLLLADFYPVSGVDTINVVGTAQLRLGKDFTTNTTRRLGGRNLQTQQRSFQMVVQLTAAPEAQASGASRILTTYVSAAVVIGFSLLW